MHVPMSWVFDVPVPTPTMTVDPQSVSPGFAGFVAIAVLALAVVVLVLDMLRRVRRAKYRSEIAEELDAEQAGRDAKEENPERG